jgi:uncharacterized protein (DUF2345 family)
VRIRTRTGHQILLHNSEDLIYIGNAAGTTWIELTSMGKIDIYAQDSISIHTEKDINIKADQDINMDAGRNVNIRSGAKHNVEVGSVHSLFVGADQKISVVGTNNEDGLVLNGKLISIENFAVNNNLYFRCRKYTPKRF